MIKNHDVLVAGGGIVGAATALALARRGFDTALVERALPTPADPGTYDPRVYAISPGSARFLDSLGVWRAVAAQRVSPYERMQVWDRSPERALTFDAAELAVPELGFIVEDSLLRGALWAALSGAVTIYAPAQIASCTPAAERGSLVLADGREIEAALIVGAEGQDSPLRDAAGIEPVGWSYPQRAIVSHVATAQPHERTAYQRFLPDGPLALLPLADGRSSIVWSADSAKADELLALDDAQFRAQLADAIDHRLGEITAATPRIAFPLRLLHATRYVKPGFALVGDSAHVVHPLAGQGVNLGLADARALAEVVDDARAQGRPIGQERVLQRYERRRKAGNLEVMALTDGLFRLFRLRLPGLDAVRELGMAAVSRSGPLKRRLAERAMGLVR